MAPDDKIDRALSNLHYLRGVMLRPADIPAGTTATRRAVAHLSRQECIALAARLGIARRVRTRADAVDAIVRWVLERPRALESIAY